MTLQKILKLKLLLNMDNIVCSSKVSGQLLKVILIEQKTVLFPDYTI